MESGLCNFMAHVSVLTQLFTNCNINFSELQFAQLQIRRQNYRPCNVAFKVQKTLRQCLRHKCTKKCFFPFLPLHPSHLLIVHTHLLPLTDSVSGMCVLLQILKNSKGIKQCQWFPSFFSSCLFPLLPSPNFHWKYRKTCQICTEGLSYNFKLKQKVNVLLGFAETAKANILSIF